MSWVMADRVGQSEHHYSAGFFFLTTDYFSTAARHFAELFTSLSVGIRGESYSGMWSLATFDAQENLNEGDRLQRPHETRVTLCLCSGWTPCYHFETSTVITQLKLLNKHVSHFLLP